MNASPNNDTAYSAADNDERLTLQILRKDLIAYLELHGVFTPDHQAGSHPLQTISDELVERVSNIVRLASVIDAATLLEAAEKFEIYSIATAPSGPQVEQSITRKLLTASIGDLKALDAKK